MIHAAARRLLATSARRSHAFQPQVARHGSERLLNAGVDAAPAATRTVLDQRRTFFGSMGAKKSETASSSGATGGTASSGSSADESAGGGGGGNGAGGNGQGKNGQAEGAKKRIDGAGDNSSDKKSAAAKDAASKDAAADAKAKDTKAASKDAKTTDASKSNKAKSLVDQVEDLRTQIDEQKSRNDELLSELRYMAAHQRNVDNDHKKKMSQTGAKVMESFATRLVDVADSLEEGLSAKDKDAAEAATPEQTLTKLKDSLTQTEDLLAKVLKDFGIEKLDSETLVGKKFDANTSEAMFQMDGSSMGYSKDTVCYVMQNGWTIKDRMLRPAKVGTAK